RVPRQHDGQPGAVRPRLRVPLRSPAARVGPLRHGRVRPDARPLLGIGLRDTGRQRVPARRRRGGPGAPGVEAGHRQGGAAAVITPAPVWDVINGFAAYWALQAAVDLGVFDALDAGPLTTAQLAAATGVGDPGDLAT